MPATSRSPDTPTELSDDQLDVQAGAGRGADLDHVGAYNFSLEINGLRSGQKTIIGGFKSMSGMSSETEVIE